MLNTGHKPLGADGWTLLGIRQTVFLKYRSEKNKYCGRILSSSLGLDSPPCRCGAATAINLRRMPCLTHGISRIKRMLYALNRLVNSDPLFVWVQMVSNGKRFISSLTKCTEFHVESSSYMALYLHLLHSSTAVYRYSFLPAREPLSHNPKL
ncbi:MAG: hypothetical protein QME62_09635 [Armatimonadota bacterium]|nr:hypothetical protein [Armatimonadota bacterium]